MTSILLYGSEAWALTKAMERHLDGSFTRLLRKALNVSWRQKMRNEILYQGVKKVTIQLKRRRMMLYGHLYRMGSYNTQPVCHALFWAYDSKFRPGGQNVLTLPRIMAKDSGFSAEELPSVMMDKKLWERICLCL